MNSQKEKLTFSCVSCNVSHTSEQGLKQHCARSSCEAPTHQCQATQERQSTHEQRQSIHEQEVLIPPLNNNEVMHYTLRRCRDIEFHENVTFIYAQIVYWRKNLFLLPTEKAGKLFIDELTKLFNAWIDDSTLKKIAITGVMIMPSLLLQKPSKESKSKDHPKSLEQRIELWQSGDLLELLQESLKILRNLKYVKGSKSVAHISKIFVEEMQNGNVNGVLKLLIDNMDHGIFSLNVDTISKLKMKHPQASAPGPIILLPDETQNIHPVMYENITAKEVCKAAINTKPGSGPLGLDGNGWRRILASNCFSDSSADLCRAIVLLTRKLFLEKLAAFSLEAFLACRLIPLNKNPGLRPIGVGEILRRIAGKVVVSFTRNNIIDSVGSFQVCAEHEAGCEALIHTMNNTFQYEQTEAVFGVNRKRSSTTST